MAVWSMSLSFSAFIILAGFAERERDLRGAECGTARVGQRRHTGFCEAPAAR